MSRRAAIALYAAGLIVRLAFLGFMGMDDMKAYGEWGERANTRGLAAAYSGIYFPLEWQIFQVAVAFAAATGAPKVAVIKAITLVFEAAIFVLLARFRRDEGEPTDLALFWCHPTFLMFSILGYVDAHFALFALLTAGLANRARAAPGFAKAGLPLAAAFLMKPQALSLMAVAFFYASARFLRRRDGSVFALFAAPLVLFAAYSAFLALGGRSIWALALTVLDTTSFMPCLTANQLNLWFPVARLVAPTTPVYFVADTASLLGPLTVRHVAALLTLVLLGAYAFRLEAARSTPDAPRRPAEWTLLFAFASLTLPMVMTNAHENHLFVAAAFFVMLRPRTSGVERAAIDMLVALSGLNLFGIYGLGLNGLTDRLRFLMAVWTPGVQAACGALAALAFVIAAGFLLAQAEGRHRRAPAAMLLALLVSLQAAVVAVMRAPK